MPNPLLVSNLIEVLASAAITHMVESEFDQSGGIFLVSPPGQLKTAILQAASQQPGVMVLSDLTVKQFPQIREQIQAGRLHTLTFLDFQKLYERKAESASNIVGAVRGLVDEGFASTAFESSVKSEIPARCVVLGAMTTGFLKRHIEEWGENGFARRFLFPTYTLGTKGHERIIRAIQNDKKLRLSGVALLPLGRTIPIDIVNRSEMDNLHRFASMQYGDETTLILLRKVMAVIRWRRKMLHEKDNSMEVMLNFCQALTKTGTKLEIDKEIYKETIS